MEPKELRQAADHLRAGRFDEAGVVLAKYLQLHPVSADAWVLMSYVVKEPARKRECLQRALGVDPEHRKARERLAMLPELVVSEPAQAAPPGEPAAASGVPVEGEATLQASDRQQASEPLGQDALAVPARPERRHLETAPQAGTAELSGEGATLFERGAGHESVGSDRAAGRGSSPRIWLVLAAIFGCGLIAGGVGLAYPLIGLQIPGLLPAATQPQQPARPASTWAATQVSLPASWTPTVTPTITPTRTPVPTSTITPTPTLVPPNPTQQARMDTIMLEVADLRGLPIADEVSSYLISKFKARDLLEEMYRAHGGSEAKIEDRKRELVALGLVKPTYNMKDNVLNSMADSLGGFFDPLSMRLYLIAAGFEGVEHYVYAHEFGHALVDQHFPFDQLGAYPVCQHDEDRCRAISGLVEGDATLLMNQWLEQYASPQDLLDILEYTPPDFALPEQFPPPFAVVDAQFPYLQGANFVQYLYDRGNWAEVNRAYADPPESTEQILHPEKYLAREAPITVQAPPLDGGLGDGWRLVARGTLGEWGTYLLLGYGADVAAQLPDGKALYAAQGWGGDRYQVYQHEASEKTTLAALWVWDAQLEADEYHRVLLEHLESRFRGGSVDLGVGDCWEANDQISCAYRSGAQVLWLLAPDQALLEAMLGAYNGFP